MEIDWKLYEEITRYIYESLGQNTGVKIEGHGKDCKVKGKSGIYHQIDVLTSHTDGIHVYKTAIECKYWKETVNKDIVMKISEIIEDSAINKGVVVSKKGFTDDAVAYARFKNIGLVELREMEEKDWEGRPYIKVLSSKLRRPEIIKIIILPSLFNKSAYDSENVQYDTMSLRKNNGETIAILECVKEFQKELHKQPLNKKVEKKIFTPMAQLINNQTTKSVFIDGFIIEGVLTERDSGLKFQPIDEIWLIMKSLFEEKSYTISKRGVIVEDKVNK